LRANELTLDGHFTVQCQRVKAYFLSWFRSCIGQSWQTTVYATIFFTKNWQHLYTGCVVVQWLRYTV